MYIKFAVAFSKTFQYVLRRRKLIVLAKYVFIIAP